MISVLCGNTAYCVKLSGKDLSGYSSKIDSVSSRKCPYYRHLIRASGTVTLAPGALQTALLLLFLGGTSTKPQA